MKFILRTLLLITLLLPAMSHIPPTEEDPYSIFIEQKGRKTELLAESQAIHLKPSKFIFNLVFADGEGVFVNASFDDKHHSLSADQEVDDVKYVGAKAMAEAKFNAEQDLLIDPESYSYWFYDSDKESHRLDKKIKVEDGRVFATKTIKTLYNVDTKTTIPLKEVSDSLYLFCFDTKTIDDGNQIITYCRKKAIIVFDQ